MTSPLPNDLLALLRQWGPRWHQDIGAGRDAMFSAYGALHASAADGLRPVAQDMAYGSHARQVLDAFAPAQAHGAPVMVFVHGGAFVRGDKAQSPTIYANVAREFAAHGWVALNMEYRLAPEAAWPQGACDVRDALAWTAAHVHRWGGSAGRVFVMAHSAGCAHAATAAWDARVRPAGGLPVRGLVLASPRVRADVRPDNPNASGVRAYFGADEAQYDDRSPVSHVRADAPPTLVALAEYENPLIDFYALELVHRLAQVCDRAHGPMPRVLQVADHNHVSLLAQFGTPYNAFGHDVRDWCARVESGLGRWGAR